VARTVRPILRFRARLGAIALGLLVVGYIGTGSINAQVSDGEQLLEQFERALNAHDEEAVVGLFASDGSMRDNHSPGEVVTPAQMRGWVRRAGERNLHAHLGEYTSSGGKTQFTIELGHGEWYRTGETPLRAKGTAEVRGGRIVALVLDPLPQEPTATAGGIRVFASPVSLNLLAALATGGLVTLFAAWVLLHRRTQPSETSVRPTAGALHSALEAWSTARRSAGSSPSH
jgi:hypothetical protein